jgi:hypothetical protein
VDHGCDTSIGNLHDAIRHTGDDAVMGNDGRAGTEVAVDPLYRFEY